MTDIYTVLSIVVPLVVVLLTVFGWLRSDIKQLDSRVSSDIKQLDSRIYDMSQKVVKLEMQFQSSSISQFESAFLSKGNPIDRNSILRRVELTNKMILGQPLTPGEAAELENILQEENREAMVISEQGTAAAVSAAVAIAAIGILMGLLAAQKK